MTHTTIIVGENGQKLFRHDTNKSKDINHDIANALLHLEREKNMISVKTIIKILKDSITETKEIYEDSIDTVLDRVIK